MSRHGDYLTIEAVVAEKGCAPIAAFVDIATGRVAEYVVLDRAWDDRHDAHPEAFKGESLRVTAARIVPIAGSGWNGNVSYPEPWYFAIVDTTDAHNSSRLIAYEAGTGGAGDSDPKPASDVVPAKGSLVSVGFLADRSLSAPVRFFSSERVLHLSAATDPNHSGRQSSTPPTSNEAFGQPHYGAVRSTPKPDAPSP